MKLRVLKSFKEQEDEMVAYWASITPEQRLAHLYEMITISFNLLQSTNASSSPSRTATITKYEP